MKKSILSLVVALALTPVAANAGMFDAVSPMGGGSSSTASGDPVAAQDKLVADYIAADKLVLAGQAKMAEALGLKTAAAGLQAHSDGLQSNNVTDKDAQAKSESFQKEIDEAQAKHPTMNKESKATYATGLAGLVAGVVKYIALKDGVQNLGNSISSASPMMLPKLQTGVFLVKSFPASAKNLVGAIQSATKFAKEQKIDVPADASKAMSF
jgi:hypothetical protein